MLVAEGLPGAIAVHCTDDGTGRTGTLIALYMTASRRRRRWAGYGSRARKGKLPGPRRFLAEKEALMRRAGAIFGGPPLRLQGPTPPAAVARLIAPASAYVDTRMAALAAAGRLPCQAGLHAPARESCRARSRGGFSPKRRP